MQDALDEYRPECVLACGPSEDVASKDRRGTNKSLRGAIRCQHVRLRQVGLAQIG